jgi:hypothetical protein
MSITFRPQAISQIVSRPSFRLPDLSMAWMRAARWSLAIAKRVYPVVLTFAIIATVAVAPIALRLAIYLPTYRH